MREEEFLQPEPMRSVSLPAGGLSLGYNVLSVVVIGVCIDQGSLNSMLSVQTECTAM